MSRPRFPAPWALPIALLALLGGLLPAACGRPTRGDTAQSPPLLETLGDLHRDIGTPVPAAQRYFDQGLRLAYGYHHEAARRAFSEAQRLDPDCAMCAWGQALVLGPNINAAMDEELAADATALADRALRLRGNARPADRELIDALARRYTTPAPEDRGALDLAYAEAMAGAAARHPEDDDIAALHAEALMVLSPWAYWRDDGAPAEHTGRIVATLERVLQRNPAHIGAIHYYIHAVEASPTPQRAERHADRLAALAPGSGHLVHMPAHSYLRVGRYHDATLSNLAAGSAEDAFHWVCCGGDESDEAAVVEDTDGGDGSAAGQQADFAAHYWHFAAMTAALHGSRALAIEAGEQAARRADPRQLQALGHLQQFVVAPLFAQVRFGQWDAVLAPAQAPAALPYPRGIWHFARGMALLRQGKTAAAQRELRALQQIVADPDLPALVLGDGNHADRVLQVAVAMLRGELALARGQRTTGLAALRAAVAAEDRLNDNAPPDWPLPVRPYLGAALLDARRPKDAVIVYWQDLARYPDNGWSLHGLARAQRAMKQPGAAADSERRFSAAWQWADVELAASRF